MYETGHKNKVLVGKHQRKKSGVLNADGRIMLKWIQEIARATE
jgi:hypothetical protein